VLFTQSHSPNTQVGVRGRGWTRGLRGKHGIWLHFRHQSPIVGSSVQAWTMMERGRGAEGQLYFEFPLFDKRDPPFFFPGQKGCTHRFSSISAATNDFCANFWRCCECCDAVDERIRCIANITTNGTSWRLRYDVTAIAVAAGKHNHQLLPRNRVFHHRPIPDFQFPLF